MLDSPLFEYSFTDNLLLIIGVDVESFVLIVLVYSEVFDDRRDVVVPENVGDYDQFYPCMIEGTAVCASEGVVGEMYPQSIPEDVDDGTVDAVSRFRIRADLRLVFVLLMQQQVSRIFPRRS